MAGVENQTTAGAPVRVLRDLIVSAPGHLHAAYLPGHEAQVAVRAGEAVVLVRAMPGPFAEVIWNGSVWKVHKANLDLFKGF